MASTRSDCCSRITSRRARESSTSTVEGNAVLTNFDISAEAGSGTALVKTFPVTIADGKLDMTFQNVVGNAALSAFELLASTPTPTPTPVSYADSDSDSDSNSDSDSDSDPYAHADGRARVFDRRRPLAEGNTGTSILTFTVTRDGDTSRASFVKWSTQNGTAGEGDYGVASGTLSFAVGESAKPITSRLRRYEDRGRRTLLREPRVADDCDDREIEKGKGRSRTTTPSSRQRRLHRISNTPGRAPPRDRRSPAPKTASFKTAAKSTRSADSPRKAERARISADAPSSRVRHGDARLDEARVVTRDEAAGNHAGAVSDWRVHLLARRPTRTDLWRRHGNILAI